MVRSKSATHVRLLVLEEDAELVDLDAGGPRDRALEDVLRLEGGHAQVRRLKPCRARDRLQSCRRQRLVHVVLWKTTADYHDGGRGPVGTNDHTIDILPITALGRSDGRSDMPGVRWPRLCINQKDDTRIDSQ